MSTRDIKLKLDSKLRAKKDDKPRYRAVLCAANGSRTAGSVWSNEDWKLVYFQFFGSGGVGVARCEKITPELGLGVYVGKTDDGLQWQVLEDDPLLRRNSTDTRNYQTVAASDFEPGGRLQLWLYTKLIVPLSTYPTNGTLLINVVAGDYPYLGVRKTFSGVTNFDLSASVPGAGLWRYVGLYLDSANAFQIVDGTASTTAAPPAEPSWPAGSFRLAAVRLSNGQTSISLADDVFDRRMVWSDELAGIGAPKNLQLYHNGVPIEYTTLALANTAAVSGDTILVYPGAYTSDNVDLVDGCNLIVIDPENTRFSTTTSQYCVQIGASCYAYGVHATVTTSHATQVAAIYINGNGASLENCTGIGSNSHATGFSYGIYKQGATGVTLLNCFGDGSGATANDNYGFRQDTSAGSIKISGGSYRGDAADIYFDGESVTVHNPYLYNGTVAGNASWAGVWDDLVLIKNTSGNTAIFGNVGYIDYTAGAGGEYVETTTASDDKFPSACVVVGPGVDDAVIFVRQRGRAKMQYTGSAPAAGDYLLFSATAGALQVSSMSPNLVAIAQAAGAGGLVDALLFSGRIFKSNYPANNVYTASSLSLSDFVATIASLVDADTITYNAPSSGAEANLVPAATGIAKLVLHNTTRGNDALISAVNTGTNTIDFVSNYPANWQVNDTVTIRSQTNTSNPWANGYYADFEIVSDINSLAVAIVTSGIIINTSATDIRVYIHPYETDSNAKLRSYRTQVVGLAFDFTTPAIPLISKRFCMAWQGSAGTTTLIFRLAEEGMAIP